MKRHLLAASFVKMAVYTVNILCLKYTKINPIYDIQYYPMVTRRTHFYGGTEWEGLHPGLKRGGADDTV